MTSLELTLQGRLGCVFGGMLDIKGIAIGASPASNMRVGISLEAVDEAGSPVIAGWLRVAISWLGVRTLRRGGFRLDEIGLLHD